MPPEGAKLPSESGGQPTARPGNVDARSAKRSARRHSVKEGRFTKDGGDVRLPPAAQPPAWLSARKSTNDRDLADVDETHPVGPITNGPPRNPGRPPSTSGAIYQIAWRRDRDVGVFELRPLEWSSEHDAGPTPPPPPMAEQSPAVPWTWRMPPAPMPEARRAHDDLVDKLLLAGWQRAGLGDMWFAHRFRAPRLLQGRAIRATAVRLLVERDPPVDAIHYREWYRLLQEHGFAVAGKKPLAVFLSQVSRSPVMHKATSAGVYALDRDAAERLRRELSQLEAELHALTSQSPSRPADGEIQTRRRELLLAIGRNERALDEALRGLFPADDGAPDHASPRRGQRP
jgi:hypothetical protein